MSDANPMTLHPFSQWDDNNGEVSPGPCPPKGCPKPTEIVCIETDKVYDFCFQQETRSIEEDNVNFAPVNLNREFDVECEVKEFFCEEVDRVPLDDDDDGLAQVTLRQEFKIKVCVTGFAGESQTIQESCETFRGSFLKTIILCAPPGTFIDCESLTTTECQCVITPSGSVSSMDADMQQVQTRGDVVCDVMICKIVQSLATVKLLVPSFGFCTPVPCVEAPDVFECPPEDLFPPQCIPPNGNTMSGTSGGGSDSDD